MPEQNLPKYHVRVKLTQTSRGSVSPEVTYTVNDDEVDIIHVVNKAAQLMKAAQDQAETLSK